MHVHGGQGQWFIDSHYLFIALRFANSHSDGLAFDN